MNCPCRSVATRPAALSTPKWCETDANAIGNCSAMSPAVRSPSARSSRMRRRVGSARARNRESCMDRYLDNYLIIVKQSLTKSAPVTRLQAMSATAVRRVLIGLLGANLVVVAAKLYIGVVSGSLAVMGDALHSSVDSLYNLLGLIVIRVAARAPDEDHPYGHGKFETLGALAIIVFLSITCFELVLNAVQKLLGGGHAVVVTDLVLVVLLATLAINVLVAWYENRRGHELSSELLIADAAHTRTDVFITIGVLIGVLFARRGATWVDPVVAIVVAALIVRVAYQILG